MMPAPERPFDEPWQARAFALAVLTVQHAGLPWDAFRERLMEAVAAVADRPYWESWLAALDGLVDETAVSAGGPGSRESDVPWHR